MGTSETRSVAGEAIALGLSRGNARINPFLHLTIGIFLNGKFANNY